MPNLSSKTVQQILAAYPDVKAQELADKYDVPVMKIYQTAKRYKVKKSAEFLASGMSGRIKNGEHLSEETELKPGQKHFGPRTRNKPKRIHPTAWRKGHKGPRTGEDGEIRFRVDGWRIRIRENEWVFYTRWLWEKERGTIPEDYNVVFKTKVDRNIPPKIEDLECISNAILGKRNSITQYPKEIRELIKITNKLTKEIRNYDQE